MAYDTNPPDKPLRLTSPHDGLEAEFARINAAFDKVMKPRPDRWMVGLNSFAGVGDSVRLANEARLKGEDR